MNWKKFLRPNWRKILIFLIFIAIILINFLTRPPWTGSIFERFVLFVLLGPALFFSMLCPIYTQCARPPCSTPPCYPALFGLFLNIILLYVISCFINLIIQRLNVKTPRRDIIFYLIFLIEVPFAIYLFFLMEIFVIASFILVLFFIIVYEKRIKKIKALDWRKIILTIPILVIITILEAYSKIIFNLLKIYNLVNINVIFFIIFLIISYIISYLIIKTYDKLKRKKK